MFVAILAGVLAGFLGIKPLAVFAESVTTVFMNFLKLLAAPIVFLAIVSTISNMQGFQEMKKIGRRVLGYTLLTTILASTVALVLFLVFNPAKNVQMASGVPAVGQEGSYFSFFLNIMPSNFVGAFLENNVIGVALMAFLIGVAVLKVPAENGKVVAHFFASVFKVVLKVAEFITFFMPLAIFAFTLILVQDLRANFSHFHSLVLYLGVVVSANLIQGLVVIPILLKIKGLPPFKMARRAASALMLAFFSKSSNATLPLTLKVSEEKLGVDPKISSFSLPLCTVINMNGCAAFILTTVLFISQIYGHTFSPLGFVFWIGLATLAAIGNAGVPMGCFFLSSTFLIWMDVPLTMMGLILPFYAFLDMVETALNVWSDISVTAIVDKEVKELSKNMPHPQTT